MAQNSNDKVTLKYGYPTDCVAIDDAIGRITKEIADLLVNQTSDKAYVAALEYKKDALMNVFNQQDCRNQIETLRLNETAFLSTKYAIQSEQNVVKSGYKEQQLYIAIGSIVILTGLFLILKK